MTDVPSLSSSKSPPPPNLLDTHGLHCDVPRTMSTTTMPILEREFSVSPVCYDSHETRNSEEKLENSVDNENESNYQEFGSLLRSFQSSSSPHDILSTKSSAFQRHPKRHKGWESGIPVSLWLPKMLQAWLEPLTHMEAIKTQLIIPSSSNLTDTNHHSGVYHKTLLRYEGTLRRTLRVIRTVPHFRRLSTSTRARLLRASLTFGGVDVSSVLYYDPLSRLLRIPYRDTHGHLRRSNLPLKSHFPRGLNLKLPSMLDDSWRQKPNSLDDSERVLMTALTDADMYDQIYHETFQKVLTCVDNDKLMLVAILCLRFFQSNSCLGNNAEEESWTSTSSLSRHQDRELLREIASEITEFVTEYISSMGSNSTHFQEFCHEKAKSSLSSFSSSSGCTPHDLQRILSVLDIIEPLDRLSQMFVEFSMPPTQQF